MWRCVAREWYVMGLKDTPRAGRQFPLSNCHSLSCIYCITMRCKYHWPLYYVYHLHMALLEECNLKVFRGKYLKDLGDLPSYRMAVVIQVTNHASGCEYGDFDHLVTWIDDLPIPSIGVQLHNGTMKMRGRHGGLCKGVVCDGLERYFWCWWTTPPYQDAESECEWGEVKG